MWFQPVILLYWSCMTVGKGRIRNPILNTQNTTSLKTHQNPAKFHFYVTILFIYIFSELAPRSIQSDCLSPTPGNHTSQWTGDIRKFP